MRRRGKKIFLIVCALIAIFGSVKIIVDRVFCYDSNVAHPRIAELAIDLYNQNFDPDLTREEKECILTGAREEDTPTRWLNHFYDPVHNKGLKGVYSSAKSWAENPSKQSSYALGDKSWQRALDDYKNDDKKKAFTELGHVLHLIADMSVPAHTRNDVHVMPGDSYEQFLKNNWNTATVGVAEKSKVRNVSSLSSAFDALATYSNNNFYSDDTVEDKNFNILKKDGVDSLKTVDDKKVSGYWFLLSGQKVYTFAEEKVLDWFRTDKLQGKKMTDVPSIVANHTSFLVPEAVGYSAGVIKLFFDEGEKLSAKEKDKNLPFFRQNLVGFANLAVGKVVQAGQGLGEAMKARFGGGGNMDSVSAGESPVIESREEVDSVPLIFNSPNSSNSPNKISNSEQTQNTNNTDQLTSPVPVIVVATPPVAPEQPVAFAFTPQVTPVVAPVVVVPVPVVHYGGGGGGGGGGSPASDTAQNTDNITQTTITTIVASPSSTPPIEIPTSTDNFATSTTPTLLIEPPEITIASHATSTITTASTTTIFGTKSEATDYVMINNTTSSMQYPSSTAWSIEIDLNEGENVLEFFGENDGMFTQILQITIIVDTTPPSTPPIETPTSTPETPTTTPTVAVTPVVINEIAWAGTGAKTSSDEWIELYNNTDSAIDLAGWNLFVSTTPIVLSGVISPRGYYLMERTKDDTVSKITADLIFTLSNGLNNLGEHLILKNANSEVVDEVDCSSGWFAGTGGSGSYPQAKYRSMERKSSLAYGDTADNWRTNIGQPAILAQSSRGADIMGTPRQPNNNFWLLRTPTYYYVDQFTDNIWHLTKEHSPYVLDFQTEIPAGYAIIIDPGVVIVGIDKSSYFDVKGELRLNGTPDDQIIFTSARDVSRLGQVVAGWAGEPESGDWSRIEVSPGAKLNISNARFYYGGAEFKKQGNWVYNLKNISQVVRNIAGAVEIDHSTFYNSFIGANDQQYNAVVWTETQIGKSASTTIKNSEFNAGWMAIKNFGQNDGQKIYSEISDNKFTNFLGPDGPVVATYHLPSLSNNVLTGNNKDMINLETISLPGDTILSNGDYEIGGALIVPVGTTLSVNSGANLKMKLGSGVDIFGKLIISGVDGTPVNIEPAGDDFWGRLDFKPGASGDLKFAYLRRGSFVAGVKPEDTGVVRALNANLNIENCAFLDAARPQNMLLLNNSQTVIKNSRVAWSTDYEPSALRWITGITVLNGALRVDNVNFDRMDVGVDASVGGTVEKDNMPDENFQNIKKYNWLPEDLFTTPPPLEEIPAL